MCNGTAIGAFAAQKVELEKLELAPDLSIYIVH